MDYLDILSGRNNSVIATVVRVGLILPSLLYGIVVRTRNLLYGIGLLKENKVDLPVICVGNLTAGGTGKTPMVIWLCKYLQSRGMSVALLSRGYKGGENCQNDEMRLLEDSLADVRFFVGPDRVRSAQIAVDSGVSVIVMDDGYQHHKLARDLNILMIDGTQPFGFGKILPAGLLREPVSGARRAGACVISRVDIADPMVVESTCQIIRKHKDMPIAKCSHKPAALYSPDGVKLTLDELADRKVTAFCSIGNPMAFVSTLKSAGADVCGKYFFDDHSEYDSERVDILRQLAEDASGQWLVTTEKDWVKLRELPEIASIRNLFWLQIEMVITENQPALEQVIDAAIS